MNNFYNMVIQQLILIGCFSYWTKINKRMSTSVLNYLDILNSFHTIKTIGLNKDGSEWSGRFQLKNYMHWEKIGNNFTLSLHQPVWISLVWRIVLSHQCPPPVCSFTLWFKWIDENKKYSGLQILNQICGLHNWKGKRRAFALWASNKLV